MSLLKAVGKTVFIIDIQPFHRNHSHHRNIRLFFNHPKSRLQDLHIPAEFVDNQTFNHGLLILREKLYSAV